MRIAILLTCFNRREKTLSCLRTVSAQASGKHVEVKIFLVDDASSDGTQDSVIREFPKVHVISGDGNLYWNGGMNLAWKTAITEYFDAYVWLNDDVDLYSNAFALLINSFEQGRAKTGQDTVIVGSFRELGEEQHAYGGFKIKKSRWTLAKRRIIPNGEIQQCDTFNGNAVLIPQSVVQKVGLLDSNYTHAFGDVDYGYRCMKKNVPAFIAPEYIGECSRNSIDQTWFSPNISLAERYARLKLPTGCPPGEFFYLYRKETNLLAGAIALFKLYIRLLFPRFWMKISLSKSGE